MFPAALCRGQNSGKNSNVHQVINGQIKRSASAQRSLILPYKGTKYRQALRCKWASKARQVSKAGSRRPGIVWPHLYELSRRGKLVDKESILVGNNCWLGDKKVLKFTVMSVFAQHCECAENHWIIHFKWAHGMVREGYFSKAVRHLRK